MQHPGTWVSANPPIAHLMTHGEASAVASPGVSNAALPSSSTDKALVLWFKDGMQ
jgi:hypothetical protein